MDGGACHVQHTAAEELDTVAKSLFERVRSSRLVDPVRGTAPWNAARAARDYLTLSSRDTKNYARASHSTRSVPASTLGPEIVTWRNVHWRQVPAILDREVYVRNLDLVTTVLEDQGVKWWWVDAVGHRGRRVIAVALEDSARVRSAFVEAARTSDHGAAWRITDALSKGSHYALAGHVSWDSGLESSRTWRIAEVLTFEGRSRNLGLSYGCDIEFWEFDPSRRRSIAPRENRAARILDEGAARLVSAERDGRQVLMPRAFEQPMLEDVLFPIDVVYTWVDGADPEWLTRKAEATGGSSPQALHEEAIDPARFRSRDELKYSMRSIDDFAPWVRHIFLVTDRQVPTWLDPEHPRITIIDHRDIFPDDGRLPVFNSNAIISRLHHIPGLSEHFIYMNDDVMLTRPVNPGQFFTGSGIALLSHSNNRRPFIEASVENEPHLNITANIRGLMLGLTGRNVSRAIKHTPHPMLRSVLYELEETFPEAYEATTRSRFRHHDDIVADQLYHYYSQATARAVPGRLLYTYLNILDDSFIRIFNGFAKKRDRDAMCVNDAPVAGATPIDDEFILDFLNDYFPAPSQFEK